MQLSQVLEQYSDAAIDQIAGDKVEESVYLRLPRSVIIQEVISALSSLTYVASALAPARPPTYAFLRLLLEAPEHAVPIEGFQDKVASMTKKMTLRAQTNEGLSADKNYSLYVKVLKSAWESDEGIDRSESYLLEVLREELRIWTREHLLLEHSNVVRSLWDVPGAYVQARNHLLITGLVLTYDNKYVLADEVAMQIRRAWGIDLGSNDYRRMLEYLKSEQLSEILENIGLQISGTKDEKIERIIDGLLPPSEALNYISITELRDAARDSGAQVSGVKEEVIANLIEYFNQKLDLQEDDEESLPALPTEQQERELKDEHFAKLLSYLTNDQLHDVLAKSFLHTSGNKDEKIERLINSTWSDRNILSRLRNIDLSDLCKKLSIQISGIKNDLIDRLIEYASRKFDKSTTQAELEHQDSKSESKSESIKEEIKDISDIKTTRKPAPQNIENISRDFSMLDEDEKIILSLIKDTKSLTEQDIERAGRLHKLGWFLPKAHMAEIIFKLKRDKKNPIKVRSVRSVNIYEWSGTEETEGAGGERRAARDVIDALRHGVVPEHNLNMLMIGQDKMCDHLKEMLSEVDNTKSHFKFIRGPYGAGKTFLSAWFREYALMNEFAVSTVNIGPDQPLSDLPVFFTGVVQGLRTPEKREFSAIADILESWLLSIHKKTAQIEGLTAFDETTRSKLADLVEERVESELAYLSDLDPGLTAALRAFYRAKIMGDQVTASTAIAWLSGNTSISSSSLRAIGVKGSLERHQVFPRIQALIEIIKGSRYKGLVLVVDELELIRKFPNTKQREQALEILRLLIDETGKNGFPGSLLIFTGTDAFFEDDRAGLQSYEALADRVSIPDTTTGMVSVKQPVITLEPFNRERLLKVMAKVRDIHGQAYEWQSEVRFSEEALNFIVDEWTKFGENSVSRKPRPVIREFVHMLDLCEENPDITYHELIQDKKIDRRDAAEITELLKH